ncbi:LacI family DNA-binding transcriptional regulator [Aureimonas flava]|uniref:LacI family DNA-binding transcriptional regulator n=1 Tax=Aureimonas flava TaxID=2320271 RepID=UPI0010A95C22|nr:LacI family DNA-binding transcriptional regulator [Aureimonas flava]
MRKPVVSIKDVASLAGVSIGTVSNVLTGKRAVKAELQVRVRGAVAELGYEPDRSASRLRGGRGRVVAVMVPDLTNPFFASLVAALEAAVRGDGYDIIVGTSNGGPAEEAARLATLLAWRPGGLVVVPCDDAFASAAVIRRSGVPFVVADRVADGIDADQVTVDNRAAGAASAEHVLGLGHRDVVVAASTMALRNIRERYAGIEGAFLSRGLPAPRHIEVGLDLETATDRLDAFVRDECRTSAFIALTNFGTLGVLSTLRRRGLRVPDDVSVIGFDDYAWMRAVSPPLSAVRQPVEAMGQAAWARLRARIDGADGPFERVRLECEFVPRASTAAFGKPLGCERAA